jgi:hypothetical protein
MAKKRKKKKSGGFSRPLSPESYIRKQANQLPIYKVLITKVWKDIGEANVVVARQHTTGNITAGYYLVDLHCLGVKDTTFQFNVPLRQFLEDLEKYVAGDQNHEIPYAQAHSIIYGALAYASSLGLQPHPDFRNTRGILDPADADLEPYEVVFGFHGRPHLNIMPGEKVSHILATLDRTVGPDNYDITGPFDGDEDEYEEEYEDEEYDLGDPFQWKEEQWESFFSNIGDYSPGVTARALEALYSSKHEGPFDIDEWYREFETFIPSGFKLVFPSETDAPESGLSREEMFEKLMVLDKKAAQSPEEMLKWLASQPSDYWLMTFATDRLSNPGTNEMAEKIAEELYEKHPEILIAKLTLARFKLAKGDTDWVRERIGPRFYPSDVTPGRKHFAALEMARLLDVAIHYHTLVGEYDTASMYHDWLWNLPVEDPVAMNGRKLLAEVRLESI